MASVQGSQWPSLDGGWLGKEDSRCLAIGRGSRKQVLDLIERKAAVFQLGWTALGNLVHSRMKWLGDAVDQVSHRRRKAGVLEKLLDFAEVATGFQVQLGRRGWAQVGHGKVRQTAPLYIFLKIYR